MRIVIIIIFTLITISTKSQVLNIDKIEVSRVITKIENVTTDNQEKGPVIGVKMNIINTTDSAIILHPSMANLEVLFSNNDKKYVQKIVPFSLLYFYEKKELLIQKGDSYALKFSFRIFSGTDILQYGNRKIYDYSLEILKTLPTIKISYKDDKFNLTTCGIRSIEIIDYDYTPK